MLKSIEESIGKRVIVRCTNAGVFYGTLREKEGQEVILTDCRRIWYSYPLTNPAGFQPSFFYASSQRQQ